MMAPSGHTLPVYGARSQEMSTPREHDGIVVGVDG